MIYNKEEIKGGRRLTASGPRNMQKRAAAIDTSEDIKDLKAEIKRLTDTKGVTSSGYTQQQVDDMINEAIEEVSVDLERKYLEDIRKLKKNLEEANTLIVELKAEVKVKSKAMMDKDKAIMDLTTKFTELSSRPVTVVQQGAVPVQEVVEDEEVARPTIDSVYIDPTEQGKTEKLESHVKVKEVKDDKRSDAKSSLDKLKGLTGGKIGKLKF